MVVSGRCMDKDICEPLLQKGAILPGGVRGKATVGTLRRAAIQGLVASLCILIGVLHPLATDATKDARSTTCEVQATLGHETVHCSSERHPRLMPFHPLTLTLAAETLSVVFTSIVTVRIFGWKEGSRRLFDMQALVTLWPIGFLYGLGDFFQTIACSQASGTVVVLISQCKLLITAALARVFLKRAQPEDWKRLWLISAAAALSTHLSAQGKATEMERTSQFFGAVLALLKAACSALGAVISERFYKRDKESFWVLSTRVQSMMLLTSLLLMTHQISNGSLPSSASELVFEGPVPRCDFSKQHQQDGWCDPSEFGVCHCVDRAGWDARTMLATVCISLNGMVTGLTLRYLSAVGKSICNVLGLAFFYMSHVLAGFSTFEATQATLIMVIMYQTFLYTQTKSKGSAR